MDMNIPKDSSGTPWGFSILRREVLFCVMSACFLFLCFALLSASSLYRLALTLSILIFYLLISSVPNFLLLSLHDQWPDKIISGLLKMIKQGDVGPSLLLLSASWFWNNQGAQNLLSPHPSFGATQTFSTYSTSWQFISEKCHFSMSLAPDLFIWPMPSLYPVQLNSNIIGPFDYTV